MYLKHHNLYICIYIDTLIIDGSIYIFAKRVRDVKSFNYKCERGINYNLEAFTKHPLVCNVYSKVFPILFRAT